MFHYYFTVAVIRKISTITVGGVVKALRYYRVNLKWTRQLERAGIKALTRSDLLACHILLLRRFLFVSSLVEQTNSHS